MSKTRLTILLALLALFIVVWIAATIYSAMPEKLPDSVYVNKPPTQKEMRDQKYNVGEKISESELVDLTEEEVSKVRIIEEITSRFMNHEQNLVENLFTLRLYNGNPFEVAAVTFTVFVKTPGRPNYNGEIKFSNFNSELSPMKGALMAFETAGTDTGGIRFPLDEWLTTTEIRWSITKMQRFKKPPPITTIRGLREAIINHPTAEDDIAFFKEHPEAIKLVDERTKVSGTLIAFAFTPPQVIEYVMQHGGDAKSVDIYGAGIMHYAARSIHEGAPSVAKKYGGDIDAPDKANKNTPLHYAAISLFPHNIRLLGEMGAKRDPKNRLGFSPAVFGASMHSRDCMKALIKIGVDLNFRDQKGRSLMHFSTHNRPMMATLRDAGIPVDIKNSINGETPFLECAKFHNTYGFEWLIKNGADVKAKDKDGNDCFELSKQSNTLKTDRFFREEFDDIKKGRVFYPENLND